jgi:putative transposase
LLADRWFPSSKLCSGCDANHGRDVNAAVNLQGLATGVLAAQAVLPLASPAATTER